MAAIFVARQRTACRELETTYDWGVDACPTPRSINLLECVFRVRLHLSLFVLILSSKICLIEGGKTLKKHV
jgi:hypothetical protein